MKKESKVKYVLLVVAIVLAIGFIVYEKAEINLKDIDLFKKDKVVNEEIRTSAYNGTDNNIIGMSDTLEDMGGMVLLFLSIGMFLLAVIFFILPLFKGMGGLGEL